MASTRAAGRTSTSLLLAGVAVASFLTALQTYVQQRDTDDLREVYAFILGRLGTGGWHEVLLALPWVLLASAVLLASDGCSRCSPSGTSRPRAWAPTSRATVRSW